MSEVTTEPPVITRIFAGDLAVDLKARTALLGLHELELTGKEFDTLELLALRKGQIVTKRMFLDHLYGSANEPEQKIIDVFVCKIRKKLAAAAPGKEYIETVWGRGYILHDPQDAPA